jgi:hypothetical protein
MHPWNGYHLDSGVDDLHFSHRRAKAMELKFGAAPLHLQALEGELGL